jgi:hypothetical protein
MTTEHSTCFEMWVSSSLDTSASLRSKLLSVNAKFFCRVHAYRRVDSHPIRCDTHLTRRAAPRNKKPGRSLHACCLPDLRETGAAAAPRPGGGRRVSRIEAAAPSPSKPPRHALTRPQHLAPAEPPGRSPRAAPRRRPPRRSPCAAPGGAARPLAPRCPRRRPRFIWVLGRFIWA